MVATITVRENGSLRVEGEFEILDSKGTAYGLAGRTAVTLCRCGQSAIKPFCDSSHRAAGFLAPSIAFDLEPPRQKG